jgi:hypothetical protein
MAERRRKLREQRAVLVAALETAQQAVERILDGAVPYHRSALTSVVEGIDAALAKPKVQAE